MKILITAFEPFNNNEVNYSLEVLKLLSDHDNINKEVLPVEYFNSFIELKKLINKYKPNKILLMGEARSYDKVSYEVIGINEFSTSSDIQGYIPNTKYIVKNGLDGIFSTLNYHLFEESFKVLNIPYNRSFSAGTYVCNALLYQALNYIKTSNLNIEVGFIHIPDTNKINLEDIVLGMNRFVNKLLKEE